MSYRGLGQLFALAAAICAWAALGLRLHLALGGAFVKLTPEMAAALFSGYAEVTALFAALALTIGGVLGPRVPWPQLAGATASYCALAALVTLAGYGDGLPPPGLARLAMGALILGVPAFYWLYWLLFVPKGSVAWYRPVLWLAYPAAYAGAVIARGTRTGHYPMALFDLGRLGTPAVTQNVALFLGASLGLGIAVYALDRLFRPLAAG